MKKPQNLAFWAALAALFLIFTLRLSWMNPPKIDTNHAFNTAQAFSRLERILGDEKPHSVDTLTNSLVRERLLSEISNLNYSPIVRDDFACNRGWRGVSCARVQNVMFWIGPPGDNAILLASHYDSVPAGPGASDDGIGMAASLEIASILKTKSLKRPVLVLITDGEEAGLIGAASFVKQDPFAKMVSSVVSLEARGVSGPAAMFETGRPNGRDIAGLRVKPKTPITNSLAADVYEKMPNGTDLTMYFELGVDAANYAVGRGVEFYHTPRDNLTQFDHRSLFHMGNSALSTLMAYQDQDTKADERNWIYTDVLGMTIIAMPQSWALPIILATLVITIFLLLKSVKPVSWRTLAFQPLAIILGVLLAVGATALVAQIRPESHFAAAHPWALRGAQNAAALTGALLAHSLTGKLIAPKTLFVSGWLWIAVIGAAVSLLVPGGAIMFTPSLILIWLACLGIWFARPFVVKLVGLFAALLFIMITAPITALGEVMLFLESAAPFALFLILSFTVVAPLCFKAGETEMKSRWNPPLMLLALTTVFIIAAIIVPAYSHNAPRALSLVHAASMKDDSAYWVIEANDPLPDSLSRIAEFKESNFEDMTGHLGAKYPSYVSSAPQFTMQPVEATVISDSLTEGYRNLDIQISAGDSDMIMGRLGIDAAQLSSISINKSKVEKPSGSRFRCYGKTCQSMDLSLSIKADTKDVKLFLTVFKYGLGPESDVLVQARPDWAVPIGLGDSRIIWREVQIVP